MSVAITEGRLRRLVDSGLRGMCRPGERITQLRKNVKGIDNVTITRMERMFFGLADRTRLMMLKLLSNEELCACEITAALDLTQPTTSHHLGILENAGLVTSRREGKWVFYRLADHRAKALLTKATTLAKGTT